MTHERIRDALESHTTEFTVGEELHAVPPHRTHEVTFVGRRAVCKLATGPEADPAVEAATMRYARRASDLPVPEVLAAGGDHFVAGRLDGLPGATDLTEPKIRAMGRGLAELHEATDDDFGGTGHLRPAGDGVAVTDPGPWSDTLLELLADRREFLVEYGYDDLAVEVAEFVRVHRRLFDTADEVALVHGNWLPEHVAVADRELAGVIDFEHALVGSPGWDYLRAVAPMFGGAGESDHGVPESVFREAYESVRPLPMGFDERRDALGVVNGVSYLKALYLQRGPLDDPATVGRRAARLARHVRTELVAIWRRRH